MSKHPNRPARARGAARRPLTVLAVALIVAVLTPANADAQARQRGPLGADAAAAAVRARIEGRILDVRPKITNGERVWRVKVLLPGGRVRVYRVDGRSGRLIE